MKYALFLGCKIPFQLPAYEASTRAVLARLGVDLVDLEFDCCGYPARNFSRDAFVAAAAHNLALAERAGLDLLTPCKCCYGSLRHAVRFLHEDAPLRARIAHALAAEGLAWTGAHEIEHLLPLLAKKLGAEALAAAVRVPQSGLRIAAQYGCHALRPSDVTDFDNPMAPTLFETLIGITGATALDWPGRTECCGDPLHTANAALAQRIARSKLEDAHECGADAVCTACPHCHLRLDGAQAGEHGIPVRALLYTQLLGRALGLPEAALGLAPGPSRTA